MSEILCRGCRKTWFDKRAPRCPTCGVEPYPVNSALASQAWRTALNEKANRALREG